MNPYVGSLRGTAWGSRSFFHWLNPLWFLQPEFMVTYLPGTGTLGWGSWCGAGTPCSQDIPPKSLSTTHICGTSLFCISACLISLDGCGFFNSVVVRLPFNSISDGSEWWLFYNWVVILMWLCKEASLVYLCCHLDRQSTAIFKLLPASESLKDLLLPEILIQGLKWDSRISNINDSPGKGEAVGPWSILWEPWLFV